MPKKTKMVECIQVGDGSTGDGPMLWRLDEKGNGDHFFRYLRDNYEAMEPSEPITVVRLTQKQWKAAEKLGRELE